MQIMIVIASSTFEGFIFHGGSRSAPFCITTRQSAEEEHRVHVCAQNNYVEINLFKLKSAPVFLRQTEI